jgi:hypothetical protein
VWKHTPPTFGGCRWGGNKTQNVDSV